MDLGIHLIRTLHGATVANRLARAMVWCRHIVRAGRQFVQSPVTEPESDDDDPVAEALRWAGHYLDASSPIGVSWPRRAG